MAGTTKDKLAATLAGTIAIKTAIENKGVEVGIAPLREYAGLIDGIETGLGVAFDKNCYIAGELAIPNNVTSIGDNAFYKCTGLTSITIPDSVTSIGNDAFFKCKGFTSITIPSSVTSIGNTVFYQCSSLTSVTIPNSVTSIGSFAFNSCTGLTSVTLGTNFNASLDLHWSTLLTASAMVAMFNQLKNNTGYTAKVLTLGSTNLEKLSTAQKAIATNKNWTLA